MFHRDGYAENLNCFTNVASAVNRRSLLTVGGASVLSSFAGCLSLLDGSNVDPEKVNFAEKEGWHVAVIQNKLAGSIEVTLSTTGKQSDIDYSNTLNLEAGESEQITDLFTNGADAYVLRVTTENSEIEKTVRSSGREIKSVFEIRSDRIEYQKETRPAPDITVSNRLTSQATFEITVDPASSSEPPVYDRIELPADGFIPFTGIFSDGSEYDVTVEAGGATESQDHRNSTTNGLSITLDQDGLEMGVFEY